jgi:isopropylmalate/homocitrate/citramalate synthase
MGKKKLTGLTDKYWITDFNYLDEVRSQFHLPDRVYIHDVTLREAEQAPHIALRPDEKIRIFQALDDMGVHSVEIFPIVSDEDKEVAKEMVKMPRQAKVFFLCRWNEWEIDNALESGADGVVIECAGNPYLNKIFFGMSEDDTIERLTKVAAYAKKNGIFTVTMPWDDYLAPMPFLERMYKSLVYDAGVDHVVIADTHGFGLPWTTAYIIGKMREWVGDTPIEMHAHNDYGLGTVAMLSAVVGGASVVHTSINALGERSGNAATEEVALDIEMMLGLDTGIKLDRIYPVCRLVSELTKIPIAMNKPVTGDNQFTFESGMVVDSIERLKDTDRPFAPFICTPEMIGRRKGYKIVIGKMTGKTAVAKKLGELQLSATKEQIAEIVQAVKREASIRKWSIPDDIFETIARAIIQGK